MRYSLTSVLFVAMAASSLAACTPGPNESTDSGGSAGSGGSGGSGGTGGSGAGFVGPDFFDIPIDGLSDELNLLFNAGDNLFDVPLRESDGLGPLYTRSACSACHEEGARGAGSVTKMVVVEADGITQSPDQSLLPYGNTVHPLTTAGATTPILAPDHPSVRVSLRVGPPILGRGYMEAVSDKEILRVEAEQAERADMIHGRINHVVYASEANPVTTFHNHKKGDMVIGRFGLKARQPTLDDFSADALQGDMGITSPLRPSEFPNPENLTDDLKPGVDATLDDVNQRADYIRLTAIPRRDGLTEQGKELFDKAKCSACHVPALKTRPDYPIAVLAGIDAPIYTDMLLHNMGDELADGVSDGTATGRDWKTAPLIGLRFYTTYLHDSRATTVDEAILLHAGKGSEANESVAIYKGLSAADHDALLAFVSAL